MNSEYLNKVTMGDSEELLEKLESNSIDIVITDPPYFLDKLDNEWNLNEVNSTENQKTITSMPSGMKFNKNKGVELYEWYSLISKKVFRVLKPGGFFFTFSSPRLYHRMACAVDDSGFEIRDAFIWLYTQNQPKAMSLNHIIDKRKKTKEKKEQLKKELDGWKTPQLKSCYEPIVMGRKPLDKNNLDNMLKHKVGLVNTNITTGDDMFPANVVSTDKIDCDIDRYFLIGKPTKKEKGSYNTHKTVKPISICKHLMKLFMFNKDGVVLDPFLGSGTTAVAAKQLQRDFIGFEINEEYVEISNKRLSKIKEIDLPF